MDQPQEEFIEPYAAHVNRDSEEGDVDKLEWPLVLPLAGVLLKAAPMAS